jgi:hypothetical protein
MTNLKNSTSNRQLKARISLIILLMITVPVIVHTRSLLLEITRVDGPRWVLEVYAIFFAVAFDCSIFMFALYKKREQAIAFAVISGIVGWLFWCSDLVFVEMQEQASGAEWARLVMGSVWAGFSAYLVFWCSEIVAESFDHVEGSKLKVQGLKKNVQRSRQKSINRSTHQPINGNNKHDQAIKLKEQGLTISEIAEKMGVSDRTVRRYQQNGVS